MNHFGDLREVEIRQRSILKRAEQSVTKSVYVTTIILRNIGSTWDVNIFCWPMMCLLWKYEAIFNFSKIDKIQICAPMVARKDGTFIMIIVMMDTTIRMSYFFIPHSSFSFAPSEREWMCIAIWVINSWCPHHHPHSINIKRLPFSAPPPAPPRKRNDSAYISN